MQVLGLDAHAGDPRFASYASRKLNEDALLPLVEPAVRARDSQELEQALMVAGVPCARVNNFKEVFDDPQIVARGVVQEVEHPAARQDAHHPQSGPARSRRARLSTGTRRCWASIPRRCWRSSAIRAAAIRELVAAGVTRMAAGGTKIAAAE